MKKTLFEKYINVEFNLRIKPNIKGEILGWAGTYLCGYVQDIDSLLDCTIIPCIWDISEGRCLFDKKHQKLYDLER